VDLELGGVEDDLGDGFEHVDVDVLAAAEGGGVEIGLDPEVVPAGEDGARQAVGGHPSRLARAGSVPASWMRPWTWSASATHWATCCRWRTMRSSSSSA